MTTISATALSRAVSHALRHEPWLYELELDKQGWTPVGSLVDALRHEPDWRSVTAADVEAMVATAPKQRHEIRDGRIRALYGHSLPGRIELVRQEPPQVLFHGTAPVTVEAIRRDGLRPMARQYVHLSVDIEMAQAVGARKDAAPVLLRVAAGDAAAAGVPFYLGNARVWLADGVPARFITPLP
ncbi:RNA 2'-phosphotransferase [Luteipulveratus sp. YIM 133132]|uniref:Probable RNA 2'-phosphotransferase n=1 Tax=Luteipulveratus flavus TaxID=3031728 RepID=A0ABT6C1S6_9MICO|nr:MULTISPECIES: RNA 2'-phosphotransferase [unclassified Luteipulveratus]MDE9364784.1 RNA 2'-phosphotransferase [Luteipulveratus sp. YIM 133132]MDF8262658.1 RNA 2'-phosphotransferase [Luteipulveratus sp. YIM 133296]